MWEGDEEKRLWRAVRDDDIANAAKFLLFTAASARKSPNYPFHVKFYLLVDSILCIICCVLSDKRKFIKPASSHGQLFPRQSVRPSIHLVSSGSSEAREGMDILEFRCKGILSSRRSKI